MKMPFFNARWLVLTPLLALAATPLAHAGCDLQIVSGGPCLADGTSGIPNVGDAYGLKVTINVKGTPSAPFRIQWVMANTTNYYDISISQGDGYLWVFSSWLYLDDSIPWSITLDPDHVSGDTNLVNNSTNGTFTAIPPATAVNLYSPRLMHGYEYSSIAFEPGSGTIGNIWTLFGAPSTHGAQQALSVTPPLNAQTLITDPYGIPIYQVGRTNVPAATFNDTNTFTVQLNNIRVNPTILRTVTWSNMASLGSNWTQWLAPDPTCESTDPAVTNFVFESLPANYHSTMTPYDTARALHCAVEKRLGYLSPPYHGDAVGVLDDGVADCGGFSALFVSSLRYVGIPARSISGFWQGDSDWHVRTEFHLPGVEWLLADSCLGQGFDPTGTYAYEFGYVPDANQFLAVDVGTAHDLFDTIFGGIQDPNWLWTGGATFDSYAGVSYLQPNGVLSLTNASSGSTSFYFTDPPTEGSVIIQTSTNLTAWSPVATNSLSGNPIYYSFPTNGLCRFYRAQVWP